MQLTLPITQGQDRFSFGDFNSRQLLAVFQTNDQTATGGRNDATRFQDRFDQMNFGKTTADTGEVGTDGAALFSQAVALDARRFLGVKECGATTSWVPARRQR